MKRWRKDRSETETRRGSSRRAPERSESSDAEKEDLASRLGTATSAYHRPPTADELRAAFSRKKADDAPPPPPSESFSSKYSTESLFDATPEPAEEDGFVMAGEDRSRTSGDYFYDPENAWAVLGVDPGASWQEIAAAHRRLAMKHHPDRLLDASDEERQRSEDAMREINVAYSVLRRLNKR